VTGEELASVSDTQKDGLDQAIQAAKAAFPLWSSKIWNERRDILRNAMEELKSRTDELCTILTAENGRPYGMAQWEITWLLDTYAPALFQMELPDVTWHEHSVGQVTKRYVPLGVVAAISPWNLPFLLSFTKVLPSLLAGNTVVLKPAVFTPLTVLRAADYIGETLPPGVLNVISGGDDLGPWMTSHPDFQKVSFTGSTETGRKVFASAAPTLKHLTLELGGNDPGIVLPDADPQAIAEYLFQSMFLLSGQGCITLKRLFVHESIYQALSEALISCAQHQKLGDGFDPATTLGPIQNRPPVRSPTNNMGRDSRGEDSAPLSRGSSIRGCRPVFSRHPPGQSACGSGLRNPRKLWTIAGRYQVPEPRRSHPAGQRDPIWPWSLRMGYRSRVTERRCTSA
jgi:acyl-CoA reductase-like NAD-dependent aldehyde dehydrogenase